MQTADVRERLYTIRLSEEERARAEAVARHYGLSVAGVIRMLLKRASDGIPSQHHTPTKRTAKR